MTDLQKIKHDLRFLGGGNSVECDIAYLETALRDLIDTLIARDRQNPDEMREAADLIESQAKRIAELEQRVADLQTFIREREFMDGVFVDEDNVMRHMCYACGGTLGSGHNATCRKAKLLAPLSGDEEGRS